MKVTIKDDRTAEQKTTNVWAVVAKDKFMSGWGAASKGASRCAWAYESLEDAERGEKWVANRSEMIYVSVVNLDTYRAPKGTAHFHIYVAGKNHPSLK